MAMMMSQMPIQKLLSISLSLVVDVEALPQQSAPPSRRGRGEDGAPCWDRVKSCG